MQLKSHSSTWSHWRWFSEMLNLSIPPTYLIPMSTLWNLMYYWSSTLQSSFRTTPCSPLLWPISHPIPTVFQHPSHLKLHHRGLTQFHLLPKGTLQLTWPQPCHINFLQTSHLIILSQIHPWLPVNIKVTSPPSLHFQSPRPAGNISISSWNI